MPLATRYVEPRSVCDSPLLTEKEARAGDALQAVSVRSMAGLIRQLGSLARHAESVMGELADSLVECHERTVELEKRTRSLIVNVVPTLDADREVLEGFEIPHPDLHFKSDKTMDQRLLSQNHAPPALLEQYRQARAPPDLAVFNVDWGDGRNMAHIYSKPDFFFENWREDIQKQTLRKMSQMDMLSPKHEVDGKKVTKRKHNLENSTGSDNVSSFARPVKKTFSLSRKPPLQKRSILGSTQSLDVDQNQAKYSTMPCYPGRPGFAQRSSPSFHRNYRGPRRDPVTRAQSLRHKSKKRTSLYLLTPNTASLYVEQKDAKLVLPNTTLEVSSGEYVYADSKPAKNSSIRKSSSFRRSKSKSPVPGASINSVLDTVHMRTVAEVLAQQASSPFALLSKKHLENLDLGSSATFDTCLSVEYRRKKEQTTFRAPAGIRQRPLSSFEMQLAAMRNDGTGASRSTNNLLRLKQISGINIRGKKSSLAEQDTRTNGPPFISNGGVVLRKRPSMLSPNPHPRPVSASFVEPPTVQKLQVAYRMSLQPHAGSLSDLTLTASPLSAPSEEDPEEGWGGNESPTLRLRPKRPAPQAPTPRPLSRTSTPDSGSSTPKAYRTSSPLTRQYSSPTIMSPQANSEIFPGGPVGRTVNGRTTPTNNSPMLLHRRSTGAVISPTHQPHPPLPPSPPQVFVGVGGSGSGGGIHRNTSSPQLPMIPIQEEDAHTTHETTNPPSSSSSSLPPPPPHAKMNGHVVVPPPYIRRDSLYISPRKQSLDKSNLVDMRHLRVSQILEMGGIRGGGDLGSSRMDLLEAIRKGIQLKRVQKKERERREFLMSSMPWDVAAILERRLAIESDSESSESESNDTEWEEEA